MSCQSRPSWNPDRPAQCLPGRRGVIGIGADHRAGTGGFGAGRAYGDIGHLRDGRPRTWPAQRQWHRPRPARGEPSKTRGRCGGLRRGGAGGCSMTTWALVPPMPKELIPAAAIRAAASQRFRVHVKGVVSKAMPGSGCRSRDAGMRPCFTAGAPLIRPAARPPRPGVPLALIEPWRRIASFGGHRNAWVRHRFHRVAELGPCSVPPHTRRVGGCPCRHPAAAVTAAGRRRSALAAAGAPRHCSPLFPGSARARSSSAARRQAA